MIRKYFWKIDEAKLEPIRRDLLQLLLTTASVLGGIAMVIYAWIVYQVASLADLIPHTLVYGLLLFVTINTRLSYRARVYATMFSIFVLSVVEFIYNGLEGDGRILMLAFVALTSYFLGMRWGLFALGFSLVTQSFLGFAIPLNWIPKPADPELDLATNVADWQLATLMYVIIAAVLVGAGTMIITSLARSLANQQTLTDQLNKERDSLEIRVHEQTADLRKEVAERQYLSTHDALTGLYNRVYFDQVLSQEMNPAAVPFSILMLDLNGLKKVNDTWGHAAGDILLQDTAEVLTRVMRGEDIVARIGGDEFVVAMPATKEEGVEKVVERIKTAILAHNENHPDRDPISIAIGAATVGAAETMEDALKRADQAMYSHKREKGQVVQV